MADVGMTYEQIQAVQAKFRGHAMELESLMRQIGGDVDSLAGAGWSHNGTYIASGGSDTTVQIWEASSGKLITTYTGHNNYAVWNIAWSPDDSSIATTGDDGGFHVWNPLTGKESPTFTYQGPPGSVTDIDWHGSQIVSTHAVEPPVVHIWNASTGSNVLTYTGHTGITRAVRWSPNGKYIASGGDDKTVQIWEASTGKRLLTSPQRTDSVTSISWNPNGQQLASASYQTDDRLMYI